MPFVTLIAITDFDRTPADVLLARAERLARAANAGSVGFQLRDRTRSTRALVSVGERLRAIARTCGHSFIVNDRLDLALLLMADALHLGEGSVSTRDARRLWGDRFVYRACHDLAHVLAADADALVLSPVLAPRKGNPPLGLSVLARARDALDRSSRHTGLFALGGVDAAGAAACLSAGAHGVAAVGAAFDTDDATPLLDALGVTKREELGPLERTTA